MLPVMVSKRTPGLAAACLQTVIIQDIKIIAHISTSIYFPFVFFQTETRLFEK